MKLYIFNPWHDMALACNDPNYCPPTSALQMSDDLSLLPAWWASEGDAVLVDNLARVALFVKELPVLPSLHYTSMRLPFPDVSAVCPWGWDITLCKKIKQGVETNPSLTFEKLMPSTSLDTLRQYSSRALSVRLLKEITSSAPGDWIGESFLCTTEDEIAACVKNMPQTLLKAPWSSSGKGCHPWKGEYTAPLDGWCRKILRTQQAVVVEPHYERRADFAMEFMAVAGNGVRFVGYSVFRVNASGSYEGNILASQSILEEMIVTAWEIQPGEAHKRLVALQKTWEEKLTRELPKTFTGVLGVDMMVARTSATSPWQVHPCVEINLRITMGWVASTLFEHYVAPKVVGKFYIVYYTAPGEALNDAKQRMSISSPQWEHGRLCSGCQPLTPIGKHTRYVAYMEITPTSI